MTIFYWCDGTWCHLNELGMMAHRSDDFGTLQFDDEKADEEIDLIVHAQVAHENALFRAVFWRSEMKPVQPIIYTVSKVAADE